LKFFSKAFVREVAAGLPPSRALAVPLIGCITIRHIDYRIRAGSPFNGQLTRPMKLARRPAVIFITIFGLVHLPAFTLPTTALAIDIVYSGLHHLYYCSRDLSTRTNRDMIKLS
jgi:hypothetical protein